MIAAQIDTDLDPQSFTGDAMDSQILTYIDPATGYVRYVRVTVVGGRVHMEDVTNQTEGDK